MHLRRLPLLLLIAATPVAATEMVFGYYPGRGAPYVILGSDAQLESGVLKDLGTAFATVLDVTPVFRFTSRARISVELENGQLHAMCSGNPVWYANPERFHWSEPLFVEENRLLIAKSATDITDLTALTGMRIGTFTNYQYPELVNQFNDGRVFRDDSNSMETAIRKLQLGRVNAVLSSNIELYYQLRKPELARKYRLASLVLARRDVHCAFSKSAPVPAEQLDQAVHKLKSGGEIQNILSHYR